VAQESRPPSLGCALDSASVRRNWFISAIVIGIAAIVIAAVAMRLSDDGPPSTASWADSVCTDLSEWKTSIESLADVGGETLTPELLRETLDDAESATSTLVADLRDLGPPDLESGSELEAELDESVAGLESSFDDLKDAADDAANASAGDFLQELAALASQFSAFLAAIQSTVEMLQNTDVAEESKAELQQAFADASSCQSLQAEG